MDTIELSPEDTATLIDYARQKYGEERWPLSLELREVRAVLMKLRGQAIALSAAPARPYEPSTVLREKRR